MIDLHSEIVVKRAISPAAATTNNTAWTSEIIDLAGYRALEFAIALGALADSDATFDVAVQHGNAANLSDAAEVTAATGLLGTNPDFDKDADNKCFRVGYAGIKRYVRLVVTPTDNTGNAFCAAVALLIPMKQPELNE